MTTAAHEHSGIAAGVRAESYQEWLARTVDAMPPLTEQQQRELRELLRP